MQSLVDEINSKQNLWTASTDQERFYGRSLGDAKKLCGTLLEETEGLEKRVYPPGELADIPNSFDARDAFKECKDVIGHVWDQSACASCWAIAPVEAFNARLCIKSGGKFNQLLSAGEMIACCNSTHSWQPRGCKGGMILNAWSFLKTHGIATEGSMSAADGCWPYNFPKCAHHQKKSKYEPCSKKLYDTPSCLDRCPNEKYGIPLDKDRHFTAHSPDLFEGTDNIKKEIMTNGPTSATFSVYEDFVSYKSGVYKHTNGTLMGIHSVEIIGWGTEKGVDYWLVMNSWNEGWGDHGTFKIAQGDCGIDDAVLGSPPAMN
ncbi:cysteine proteinase, putative [Perkinsus marinus ATCC 50983]|uniref:Cysteine proteinase, putative n=1 Tax=Perkinsus marinus (strain ATCC 50983 / TXsc) TaxID=423536 RepID=C5KQW0_PERM5|nr:cysteine proteinase, putative [Perkinsus marinus ATCC 50983]EER13132.1 cysteine proteinase, putative [Perkinsus marinus ATCC 50983]|eukprot:XP_002781337.1 cysteine proteinase, putative [Perkinsus marinus ATCC 50983]